MFRLFNTLTEASNHYVDWSRIGELLQSSTHRYSREQLITRGSIAAFTAVSAYLGAAYNDEEKTHCSTLQMVIAAGFLGFTISHLVVILPLINKRIAMRNECEHLIEEIELKINQMQPVINPACRENINAVINQIRALSLSDNKHSNASLTWGRRKSLLTTVSECLDERNFDPTFWHQTDMDAIIKNLSTMQEEKSNSLRI